MANSRSSERKWQSVINAMTPGREVPRYEGLVIGQAVGSTVTLCRAGIQHRVRMTGNQPGHDDLLPRPALVAKRAAYL